MHTLPQWSSPHFMNDGKPSFSPPPVMMDSPGTALVPHPNNHKQDVQSLIRRSEEMFLIPNGLSDVVAFGVALLIISLLPFLLQH